MVYWQLKGVKDMIEDKNITVDNPDIDKTLLQAIERGIDDLENDRVLLLFRADL